jgi:hypothetical protein
MGLVEVMGTAVPGQQVETGLLRERPVFDVVDLEPDVGATSRDLATVATRF